MEDVVRQFEAYKQAWEKGDLERCSTLMAPLRIAAIASLPFVGPQQAKNENKPAYLAPRKRCSLLSSSVIISASEILEHTVLLALKKKDDSDFERAMSQLRVYYFDYSDSLPESPRMYTLLGAYLLFLLTENRIGEFHTVLELVADHQNRYIKFATALERHKVEGRYNKVWSARELVPSDLYLYFTEKLINTARNDIADSIEAAYETLSAQDACKLLSISNSAELQKFAGEREWRVEGDSVSFGDEATNKGSELNAWKLIGQSLQYANELERII